MYFKDVELAEKLVEKWCKEMNYTKEYEIRALPKKYKDKRVCACDGR